jgi:hypothetical protein
MPSPGCIKTTLIKKFQISICTPSAFLVGIFLQGYGLTPTAGQSARGTKELETETRIALQDKPL